MAEARELALDNIVGPPDEDQRREDEWLLLLLLLMGDRQPGRVMWRSLSPAGFGQLYDAQAFVARPVSPPSAWFLVPAQQFQRGARAITDLQRIAAVDRFTLSVRRRVDSLTRQLLRGEITLAMWQVSVRSTVLAARMAMAAIGRGGVGQLTAADDQRLAAAIAFQYFRLDSFAQDLAAGRIRTVARVLGRANDYVSDLSQEYEVSRWDGHIAAGFREARNRLSSIADHCTGGTAETPDCPTVTARQWVPIREMVPPGQRICSFQCKCRLEFR